MIKAFEIAGYTEEDVKVKFGALFKAFSYGTPPHAIAFPKNKKARDVMMNAPSKVADKQLEEVHIEVIKD